MPGEALPEAEAPILSMPQGELALQLQGGDAIGVGGHKIGRPEPSGQRQFGVVHDRDGGHRGLLAAAGARVGPRLGLQFPGFGLAAARADKAVRPARCKQVCGASCLIRETHRNGAENGFASLNPSYRAAASNHLNASKHEELTLSR
jgi:hypothetical protein